MGDDADARASGPVTDEEAAALRAFWSGLLSDPQTYDPRAGGAVYLGGSQVADLLRDGLRLLAERDRLERERDEWRATAETLQSQRVLAEVYVSAAERAERLQREVERLRQALADEAGEVERLREVLGEATIVLEALWLAEHDGTALAPTTKAAIRDVLPKVRVALAPGDGTKPPGAKPCPVCGKLMVARVQENVTHKTVTTHWACLCGHLESSTWPPTTLPASGAPGDGRG